MTPLQTFSNMLSSFEKDIDSLSQRMLVGDMATLSQQLDDACQKVAIMCELVSVYRKFLDTAVKSVAIREFSCCFTGKSGLNKTLLQELKLPPCMIQDLACMDVRNLVLRERLPDDVPGSSFLRVVRGTQCCVCALGGGQATELLQEGRFADLRALLHADNMDKLQASGGNVVDVQSAVWTQLVQQVLRDRRLRDQPSYARETLLALLKPLVPEMRAEEPVDDECLDSVAVHHADEDPFAELLEANDSQHSALAELPEADDAGKVSEELPFANGVAKTLLAAFRTVLAVLQAQDVDLASLNDAVEAMTKKREEQHPLVAQFTNPAEGQRLLDFAVQELAADPDAL